MERPQIDDPLKIITFCNQQIAELIALKDTLNDETLKIKAHGQIIAWTELLEKAVHQAYQQGKTRRDVTQLMGEKKRGRPRIKR